MNVGFLESIIGTMDESNTYTKYVVSPLKLNEMGRDNMRLDQTSSRIRMRAGPAPILEGNQQHVLSSASELPSPGANLSLAYSITRNKRRDVYYRLFLMVGLFGVVISHISHFLYEFSSWNKNYVVIRRTSTDILEFSTAGKEVVHTWKNQTIRGGATNREQFDETPTMTTTIQRVISRPTLILHVGPGKMATTFLQCVLAQSQDLLLQDGYVFLGKTPTSSQCQVNASALQPPPKQSAEYTKDILYEDNSSNGNIKLNPSFAKILLKIHNEGKNAILISEHLSIMDDAQVRALAEQLTTTYDNENNNTNNNTSNQMTMNWNIRIVIGYRRLYDFLPSRYSQMYKPKWKNPWANPWPGHGHGEAILPFDIENRGNFSTYFVNMEKTRHHLSENIKSKFNAIFPDVTMINLNELPPSSSYSSNNNNNNSKAGDDHLTYMLCHVIHNAPHMCRAASSGLIGGASYKNSMSSNPSFPMNYDILATTAYSVKQLIRTPEKTTRRQVIQAIQYRQEQILNKTINDFPLVCLDNVTLNRIIDLSVTMEKRLFPDTLNETAHRDGFATAVYQKKFCSIDANKLLDQDLDWQHFLYSL